MPNKISKTETKATQHNKILTDYAIWKGFLCSLGILYSTELISDNPLTNPSSIEQPEQIPPNPTPTRTGRQSWRQIQ